MSERYYIPVNLDKWKWPRRINPHYAEVKAASSAWVRSFGAVLKLRRPTIAVTSTASQLLGIHYRTRPVNVHFVFDEYTDMAREEEV
ncbi:hypothetical protein EDB84DRAFT_1563153 [Lactarius hengduanensis]|nr:hypothetical protein EDB85DRAFT_2150532 [Lactarius pseudohatsudake]KAH9028319.1 hypothetical protein EDB84DRAFT_1563153 [Lactarius hengduanensis]